MATTAATAAAASVRAGASLQASTSSAGSRRLSPGVRLARPARVAAATPKIRGGIAVVRAVSTSPSSSSSSTAAPAASAASPLDTDGAESVTALQERVRILAEAVPYLQRFAGQTIVVKYGGAAMKDPRLKSLVVRDLVLLSLVGVRPVLVHGGGPEINGWLTKIGLEAKFLNGLRVTDGPTMEVVEMVLTGRVNKSIVALIHQAGGNAVGICGTDGRLIKARRQENEALGFVGDVLAVNPKLINSLVATGHIPVVASVSCDDQGQPLNLNADIAAGELAAALCAEKLILMTDVPGVMRDPSDLSSIVREMRIEGAHELINEGVISGGMIPKVECCIRSLAQGVRATHIIDGRMPHSLLLELLTTTGVGTMITG
eukprot:jgi/Chlat1/6211/Chrsp44S05804